MKRRAWMEGCMRSCDVAMTDLHLEISLGTKDP